MRRHLGVLVMVVVLAAGCSSPTEHGYGLTIRRSTEAVETGATVTGLTDGIEVHGSFSIPCADGLTRGELQRPGARELVLVVHAEWPEPCEEGVSYFIYDAAVYNLNAGNWHVQVLHTSSSEAAPPNTVFSDFVVVM